MKNLLGLMVLGVLISTAAFADSPVFPVDINASFAGEQLNTLVKVEGTKLRISVTSLEGTAVTDYSMDIEERTIAKSPGDLTAKGSEGYDAIYGEVMDSLNTVKTGLAQAGDTANVEYLDTTISYLETLE